MVTVQLKIEESRLDMFLAVLKSLRSDIVEDIVVRVGDEMVQIENNDISWIEEVSDEENEHYIKLLENLTDEDKQISSKEYINI